MRLKDTIRICLMLALLGAPAIAQNVQVGMPIKISRLPACTYQRIGVGFPVYDAASSSDCTTGGGTGNAVICSCDGAGTWVASAAVNTGISRTGQILIAAAGAGNDVTTTAADDIILTSTDDTVINPTGLLNITPGESAAITTTAGAITLTAGGTTQDITLSSVDDLTATITDDIVFSGQDFLPTLTATAVLVAPATTFTATTSILATTPKLSISGVYERKVTNVTVADDAGGTKPTGAIPITTDYATCTCNDATGCTMSIAEPTVTSGYGRSLTIVSIGTGNCEFADSAGVTEIGNALVLEPTSTATYVYANAAWHLTATTDNVP